MTIFGRTTGRFYLPAATFAGFSLALLFPATLATASPAEAAAGSCSRDELFVQASIEQPSLQAEALPLEGNIPLAVFHHLQPLPDLPGEPDMLLACDAEGRIAAIRFEYTQMQFYPLSEHRRCNADSRLFTVDVNNDGRTDIVLQNAVSGRLAVGLASGEHIYRWQEAGSLNDRLIGTAYLGPDAVAELLVAGAEELQTFRLGADGTLSSAEHYMHFESSASTEFRRLGPGAQWYVIHPHENLQRAIAKSLNETLHQNLVDFRPPSFDWFSNYIWSDINADGRIDLISFPAESAQPWAGLNSAYKEQSGEIVFIELPLALSGLPDGRSILLSGGDFSGDGAGDLLLYQPKLGRYFLAVSRAAAPASGEVFRIGEKTFRGDSKGRFCLPRSAERFTPELLSEEYTIARLERFRDRLWISIKLQDALSGAFFALGRTSRPPYVCYGYNPSIWHPGMIEPQSKWGRMVFGRCSRSHGIFFTGENAAVFAAGVYPSGTCCPLPAADIWAEDSPFVFSKRCPDEYLAVGIAAEHFAIVKPDSFVCRKVNTERYELGPAAPGMYWGHGFSAPGARKLRLDQLPPALRYGAQRETFLGGKLDGCVGDPPGSLLAGFGEGDFCEGHLYRQLRYKGLPGDPPAGTPVKMFPECIDVADTMSPLGHCVMAETAVAGESVPQ